LGSTGSMLSRPCPCCCRRPAIAIRDADTLTEADAVLTGGSLTELDWNFTNRRTQSDGTVVLVGTVVGQLK
jgi:hypothetical protein